MNPRVCIGPRSSWAGGLALVAVLASAGCSRPEGDMTPTEARNEIVARTFIAAWASADTTTLTDLFDPDAVYDDYAGQDQHQGIQEIVGYVTSAQTWATGINIDAGAIHVSEHGATIEWVFSAIQDRPIGTRIPVATGNDVVMNGVTILEIDKGRITRAADYVDELPLLLQLGSKVDLPGGGTIVLDDVLPPPADSAGGAP